jgi:hypothetical protein
MALPTLAVAASIGSSIVSGASSLFDKPGAEREAARKAAIYNKSVARLNRLHAEANSKDALRRGDIAAVNKAQETSQLVGLQRAMLAAKGLDPNQGSAAQLQVDAVGEGKLEELTIEANAVREALGFDQQAELFLIEERFAEADRARAVASGNNPFDAIATIVTTGVQTFGKIKSATATKPTPTTKK